MLDTERCIFLRWFSCNTTNRWLRKKVRICTTRTDVSGWEERLVSRSLPEHHWRVRLRRSSERCWIPRPREQSWCLWKKIVNQEMCQVRFILRSSIDGFGQSTCLSSQMETQVQILDVREDFLRQFSNASMSDVGEDRIAKFTEESRTGSGRSI